MGYEKKSIKIPGTNSSQRRYLLSKVYFAEAQMAIPNF
jgi:hypothetical protein